MGNEGSSCDAKTHIYIPKTKIKNLELCIQKSTKVPSSALCQVYTFTTSSPVTSCLPFITTVTEYVAAAPSAAIDLSFTQNCETA